uniref:Uncharacterized protein n=1 Tax=Arion vulgaris TaxID=1028688 RepID=A0A0B7A0N7_9EUPU
MGDDTKDYGEKILNSLVSWHGIPTSKLTAGTKDRHLWRFMTTHASQPDT